MFPHDGSPFIEALALGLRLILAAVLGGVLGYERQRSGKFAGLRTHMLVALGSATLVVATIATGGSKEGVARVVQGAAAGIGFIGAGPILKGSDDHVRGLTTAAGIWVTAAIGLAAGMGSAWVAIIGTVVSWLILGLLERLEPHPNDSHDSRPG